MNKTALITGGSSGIGMACARALVQRGWRVFVGTRDGKLSDVPGAEVVCLDVTDAESIAQARDHLRTACDLTRLDALVNNAGVVVPGPLEGLSVADIRHQFEVNVIGVQAVTAAFLPMLREARGRIVMVGSINGRLAKPIIGAYSASKHALAALADAWRLELAPWRISVSLIEPARVETPLWGKVESTVTRVMNDMAPETRFLYATQIGAVLDKARRKSGGIPPQCVVQAVLRALESHRPRSRYLVGANARLQVLLHALLPRRVIDRLILRQMGLK